MSLLEVVERVRDFLQRNGRISYRMLRREFDLDDEGLEELLEELVEIQGVAARGERALTWAGESAPSGALREAPAPAQARTPRDYTPKHLADKILQSKSALEGERKQVTVLFADVKGSMELAEQVDPEEWHRILDRFFQILADGVHRFEGTVNQYTGDGIMALFGAPDRPRGPRAAGLLRGAAPARRAARATPTSCGWTQGLNFSVRMGLNSGEVVVGKIGDDLRMDYTAQGQTVGLAARMEQLAEPGKVYLTEHTADAGRGLLRARATSGAFEVKGVARAAPRLRARGRGRAAHPPRRARARGASRASWAATTRWRRSRPRSSARVEGNGQVVGVVGEAGVGKSRLCFEFVERCRARGIRGRRGPRRLPTARRSPSCRCWSCCAATSGSPSGTATSVAREKIAGRLLLLDEEFEEALPLRLRLPRRPRSRAARARRMDPEARQRQLFAVVQRLSRCARAQREPARDPARRSPLDRRRQRGLPGAAGRGGRAARARCCCVNFRPEYQRRLDAAGPTTSSSRSRRSAREAIDELLRDLLGDDASLAGLGRARSASARRATPSSSRRWCSRWSSRGASRAARGAYRLVDAARARSRFPARCRRCWRRASTGWRSARSRCSRRRAVIGKEFAEPRSGARSRTLPRLELAEALRRAGARPSSSTRRRSIRRRSTPSSTRSPRRWRYDSQLRRAPRAAPRGGGARDRGGAREQARRAGGAARASLGGGRGGARGGRAGTAAPPSGPGDTDLAEALRALAARVRAPGRGLPETDETVELGLDAARDAHVSWRPLGLGSSADYAELFAEGRALAERSGDARARAALLHEPGVGLSVDGAVATALRRSRRGGAAR